MERAPDNQGSPVVENLVYPAKLGEFGLGRGHRFFFQMAAGLLVALSLAT
jgi:hypothetical protein